MKEKLNKMKKGFVSHCYVWETINATLKQLIDFKIVSLSASFEILPSLYLVCNFPKRNAPYEYINDKKILPLCIQMDLCLRMHTLRAVLFGNIKSVEERKAQM